MRHLSWTKLASTESSANKRCCFQVGQHCKADMSSVLHQKEGMIKKMSAEQNLFYLTVKGSAKYMQQDKSFMSHGFYVLELV